MLQKVITLVLRPMQIEREIEWYIWVLKFIEEEALTTWLDDEATKFNKDDDSQSTHYPTFQAPSIGFSKSSTIIVQSPQFSMPTLSAYMSPT